MFDPSKEATLARKYEAAAERGFFKALKEFRQVEREAMATSSTTDADLEAEAYRKQLASFFPEVKAAMAAVETPRPTPPTGRHAPAHAFPGGLDGLESAPRGLVRGADHDRPGRLSVLSVNRAGTGDENIPGRW